MPSQRNKNIENKNQSKNTRMDFSRLGNTMDYRKDELMHIGRYTNASKIIIDQAKNLKRPVRVLDIGCGEMNTIRLLNHSTMCKKSEIVEEYIGVDIDSVMAEKSMDKYSSTFKTCNCRYIIKDLTIEPKLDFDDGYFDVIICFEFLEHINPCFSSAIVKEANRLLNKDGVAIFSTPNSNGSNKNLPEDHFYEYSYEELITKFKENGFAVVDAVGVCINLSKIPKEEQQFLDKLIKRYKSAFGNNTAFMSVAVAPLFNPKNCKNVVYHLRKEN